MGVSLLRLTPMAHTGGGVGGDPLAMDPTRFWPSIIFLFVFVGSHANAIANARWI